MFRTREVFTEKVCLSILILQNDHALPKMDRYLERISQSSIHSRPNYESVDDYINVMLLIFF